MPAVSIKNNLITYKGSSYLRQRLIQSTLSGKSLKVIEIRNNEDEPGLREYEVSLIRLLDKITNGTIIELNETGTQLFYQPGLLNGGTFHHDCSLQRGIGYYLEVLLMLGVFCKNPLNVTLRGVTSHNLDPSIDHLKTTGLNTLKKFMLDDEGLDIKIVNRGKPLRFEPFVDVQFRTNKTKKGPRSIRSLLYFEYILSLVHATPSVYFCVSNTGMLPQGGGKIIFKCPVRKQLRPIQFTDPGMVKRIRGTSYALRVSPAISNRMVETSKGVMLKFLPDVYINTDQCRGKQSGKSPGFGINLTAETTNNVYYSADNISNCVSDGQEPSVPEDVGTNAAQRLLNEIYFGGCVDSVCQSLAILFMALGPKDVSKLMTGPLSECSIAFLQHLREFFGVTFKLEHFATENEEDILPGADKILLTCVGIGYTNVNRRNL